FNTGSRIIMGSVADKIGSKLTLIISFILLLGALVWLLFARELWMLYLFAVIFGFSYGTQSAMTSPMVAEHFGLGSHGVVLGAIMLGVMGGVAVGPVLAGHIFDITDSYNLAFLIYAIAGIIGLILISLLKSTRKEVRNGES
ncbi:MFS transporter, partial [Chloroflexota bacterium]